MPLKVNSKTRLVVNFWRKTTQNDVWYEWQPEIYIENDLILKLQIHNFLGKYFTIKK